jgi:hypothetical protein
LAAVDSPSVAWSTDSLKTTDNWNTLSLDVAVVRSRVDKNGASVAVPAPKAVYHVERSSRTGSWKTVVTVLSIDRFSLYALNGTAGAPSPLPVARLEDDEDGTPVRVYDALGRTLALPPPASPITTDPPLYPTRVTGQAWINALVATGANKSARQQNLERKFGKATKVNGLSRYAKKTLDITQEVFVDAKTIVPLEDNILRGTKRIVHRSFAYSPAYTEAQVRSRMRSEIEASPTSDDLVVHDTTFTNVKLQRR